MRNKIKIAICLFLIILAIFSAGCESARELNTLVIVMGIGLDVDHENPDNHKIIAQIVLPDKITSGENTADASEKVYSNVESSAANTFEAIREFTHVLTGKLYISHNQIFLISRELAEKGISPYLDFFIRAKETRPTTKIVITDSTAKSIMDIPPQLGKLPAIYISQLIEAQASNSESHEVNVIDYINAMQNRTSSFIAPITWVEKNNEKQLHNIMGMAVFKEDKMVGELDEDQTRGLLWIRGWVKSGTINVDIFDGIASLEIMGHTREASPVISGDNVTIEMKVSAQTVLAEQTCKENLETIVNIQKIQKLAEAELKKKIEAAFLKAKALHADCLGFDGLINKYYPKDWNNMKDNWDKVFQKITLDLDVDVVISAAGKIEQPVWSTDSEKR